MIPRAETIAAVLEASDGHYGRVCEESPPSDRRSMARVVYRPPVSQVISQVSSKPKVEARTCEQCWRVEFTVPRSSTRRLCEPCRADAQRGLAPAIPDVRCPFCTGTFRVDFDANVVTHLPPPSGICGAFVIGCSGADFVRKAARNGARVVTPTPEGQSIEVPHETTA